jgi:hypothetical protein
MKELHRFIQLRPAAESGVVDTVLVVFTIAKAWECARSDRCRSPPPISSVAPPRLAEPVGYRPQRQKHGTFVP